MMQLFSPIFSLILFSIFAFEAHASFTTDSEIINNEFCLSVPESNFESPHTYDAIFGLSCSQLKKLDKIKGTATSIVVVSAKELMSNAVVRNQLINGMLAAGYFASANPAVAMVTVIGAYGISRFYIALNASIEECELQDRVQLELRIRRELQEKYQIQ